MLGYHLLRQALKKRFGEKVVLVYQEVHRPGPWAEAATLAQRIVAEGLPLPVTAVGEEIVATGGLPRPENLVARVEKALAGGKNFDL